MRDNQGQSYCYVGIPEKLYSDESTTVPFPPGFVFAVFLDRNLEILKWNLVKADEREATLPEDFRNRFSELIWPKVN